MTATKNPKPRRRRSGKSPAPKLGLWGAIRFLWTQLTAMRTALILLFLLALGAIPGSLLPQRSVSASKVDSFFDDHTILAPIYDKVGLFNVYTSPWFSAIYLLLFVSLLGCIVPRIRTYISLLRAPPPKTPRFLHRMPGYRRVAIDETGTPDPQAASASHGHDPAAASSDTSPGVEASDASGSDQSGPDPVISRVAERLRSLRYRVAVKPDGSVSAERGYLREAGNLLFHVSMVILLVGVAVFWLSNFRGTSAVVVGHGFSNTLAQYDDFKAGPLFGDKKLSPFTINVKHFDVDFERGKTQRGAARKFTSQVDVSNHPGGKSHRKTLKVNEPLDINGSRVHLLSWGYAPVVKVRDAHGDVAYSGPVIFLPQDGNFTSVGAIKAPDGKPQRLGFEGIFVPSAAPNSKAPRSIYPDKLSPQLYLNAWYGKPKADSPSQSESVYSLNTRGMHQILNPAKKGEPYRFILKPGESQKLPGGKGSIQLTGVKRWVKLQVSDSPGTPISLAAIGGAVLGLCLSLFIRPRRVWARIRTTGGRRMLEIAGLDKADARTGLDTDLDRLGTEFGVAEPEPDDAPSPTQARDPNNSSDR